MLRICLLFSFVSMKQKIFYLPVTFFTFVVQKNIVQIRGVFISFAVNPKQTSFEFQDLEQLFLPLGYGAWSLCSICRDLESVLCL